MLLEHLLEFDIKRRALELQRMLLEHPYGEYMRIELEAMPWQDAFDGSDVKLGPAVMDKPTIVLKVNDEFDSQRVEQYGPDRIRVVMTQDSVFVTWSADEPNKFIQYDGKGSLETQFIDRSIVNRVLKHFLVMPSVSRRDVFSRTEADDGVSKGLSFMANLDNPKFYRHTDTLTSKLIQVGQLLLVRSKSPGIATILELMTINSGEQQFSSMQKVFEHFKATSLSSLLKATTRENRVVLDCKNVGTDVQAFLHIRPTGASGSWVYDRESCSLALMEQI